MDMPNENMPVIQKEVEAWECVICYEGGKKTGQLTLACGHTMCLGCYTCEAKRVAGLGQDLKCPYCRKEIRLTEGPTKEEQDKINKHIQIIQLDNTRLAGIQKQMEEIQKQIADRKVKVLKLAEDAGADMPTVQAAVLVLAEVAAAPPQIPQAAAAAPRFQQAVPAMPPPHVPMANPGNGERCPGCRNNHPPGEVRYRHMPMVEHDGINDRRLKRCGRCLLVQQREAIIWRNAH